MKFDLHIHTNRHSPDSQIDPLGLVRRAERLGLNGVVITEHDWLWTGAELDELRALATNLLVLAGVEVSALEGHFLAYGVRDPFAIPKGIAIKDLCREVHRQGGAVVAAHPFRWGQPFDEILYEEQPELDGVEMMTSNMDGYCRRRTAELVGLPGMRPLAGLGSSDAHQEETLAACYTVFEGAIRDGRDLIEAIRSRRSTAHDRLEEELTQGRTDAK
jgi:predicted metal-dependent phosphoesterase TrpH